MFDSAPDEWRQKPLRDLADYISRGSAPNYASEETSIRAVSQKCVRDGRFDLDQSRPHNEAKPVRETAYLHEGDICINSTGTGTLGRVALWPGANGRYFADTHVTIVRPNQTAVDSAFLAAYLGMPSTYDTIYRECVTGSTNQIELSKTSLGGLVCPVPPLDEQRLCAAVTKSSTGAAAICGRGGVKSSQW
jgi:type I restriction enzyme S subunit